MRQRFSYPCYALNSIETIKISCYSCEFGFSNVLSTHRTPLSLRKTEKGPLFTSLWKRRCRKSADNIYWTNMNIFFWIILLSFARRFSHSLRTFFFHGISYRFFIYKMANEIHHTLVRHSTGGIPFGVCERVSAWMGKFLNYLIMG